MAVEKLSDGIRKFAADAVKLEVMIKVKLRVSYLAKYISKVPSSGTFHKYCRCKCQPEFICILCCMFSYMILMLNIKYKTNWIANYWWRDLKYKCIIL